VLDRDFAELEVDLLFVLDIGLTTSVLISPSTRISDSVQGIQVVGAYHVIVAYVFVCLQVDRREKIFKPRISTRTTKAANWILNPKARAQFRLRPQCVTALIHDNMDEPPPYSARDPIVLVRRIADFIDYHDYPKLCLVSSIWRDVFQAHMWTQPDRYFTTRNRSTTGRSHSSLLGDRLME
jgi:hypothetical protein